MKQDSFLNDEEIELLDKIRELFYVPPPKDVEIYSLLNKIKKSIEMNEKKILFFNLFRNPNFRIALSSFLILIIFFFIFFNHQKENKIQLIKYHKDIKIIRDKKVILINDNISLQSQDLVVNEGQQEVYLKVKDRFIVSQDPSSSLLLREIKPKNVVFEIKNGRVNFWVNKLKKDDRFEIYSDGMKISVIGTVFSLNKIEDFLEVTVKEGKVSVVFISNEIFIGEGESFIFSTNGNIKKKKADENLKKLQNFYNSIECILSNDFIMLHIETTDFPAKCYLNSTNYGRTPVGVFIQKNQFFDMEIVSTQGVLRKTDQKSNRDKKYIFSLKDYKNKYFINFNDILLKNPNIDAKKELISIVDKTNAFIIDMIKKEVVNLKSSNGEWLFSQIIREDNILLYNKQGKIESYNKNGNKNWEVSIEGGLWFNTKFAFNNKYIAILTVANGIYILDLNGNIVDQIDNEKTSPGFPMPLIDEKGILYYVDEKNSLTAYNIINRNILWSKKLTSICEYMILDNEKTILIYFREEGALKTFSKDRGEIVWELYISEIIKKPISLNINNDFIYLYCNALAKDNFIIIDSNLGTIYRKLTFNNNVKNIKLNSYGSFYFIENFKIIGWDSISNNYKKYNVDSNFLDFYCIDKHLYIINNNGIEKINLH